MDTELYSHGKASETVDGIELPRIQRMSHFRGNAYYFLEREVKNIPGLL